MISKMDIKHYRKLKNVPLKFSNAVNVISGTNGTCKTSVLHMASNSFQAVNKSCTWVNDFNCLTIINKINNSLNPKIESLTRGDKKYNDPAPGTNGTLFSVEYCDNTLLPFRRHNSKINQRFAVKPYYPPKAKQSLPFCPVIYLGLSRLVPYGEFQNDDTVISIDKQLPLQYKDEINKLYESFTGLDINLNRSQKMGDIKVRADFDSNVNGIDSNTISAGEDNLYIIIASLVSLKYYFHSINSTKDVESILLVDELDATLHPSFQIRLLNLFREYAGKYKIQFLFTTHSLSLLEEALNKKDNVIYLKDNIQYVTPMLEPDIYKIKTHLYTETKDNIFLEKKIPIFTEDEEARLFIDIIFDYFIEKYNSDFLNIKKYFHFVNANIGCENLKNIFSDSYLLRSTMRSICILDGDQRGSSNINNLIITLPGAKAPEGLMMDYAQYLFDNTDITDFWNNEIIDELGFSPVYYRDYVKKDITQIDIKIQEIRENNESTKGIRRAENKKIFKKYQRFFELLFKHWIRNTDNSEELDKFYRNLHILFLKVSEFHGINTKEWAI